MAAGGGEGNLGLTHRNPVTTLQLQPPGDTTAPGLRTWGRAFEKVALLPSLGVGELDAGLVVGRSGQLLGLPSSG